MIEVPGRQWDHHAAGGVGDKLAGNFEVDRERAMLGDEIRATLFPVIIFGEFREIRNSRPDSLVYLRKGYTDMQRQGLWSEI
jgi:hypothetical protein